MVIESVQEVDRTKDVDLTSEELPSERVTFDYASRHHTMSLNVFWDMERHT